MIIAFLWIDYEWTLRSHQTSPSRAQGWTSHLLAPVLEVRFRPSFKALSYSYKTCLNIFYRESGVAWSERINVVRLDCVGVFSCGRAHLVWSNVLTRFHRVMNRYNETHTPLVLNKVCLWKLCSLKHVKVWCIVLAVTLGFLYHRRPTGCWSKCSVNRIKSFSSRGCLTAECLHLRIKCLGPRVFRSEV